MVQLSDEQVNNLNIFLKTTDNLQLNAVAGSGKTFMIERMIEAALDTTKPASIYYLVFNSRNQKEAAQRMPTGVNCRTVHSIGYQAWREMRSYKQDVDKGKSNKIRDALGIRYDDFPGFSDGLARAKAHGLIPDTVRVRGRSLLADTTSHWEHLLVQYGIDTGELETEKAISLLQEGLHISIDCAFGAHKTLCQGGKPYIDFDDMIFMPTCFGGIFPTPELIFVDEAQDLSDLQRAMIESMVNRNTRVVIVGDPNQAIYGFRGASADSFTRLGDMFVCQDLVLTKNFRCDQAIIDLAQELVPRIQAGPLARAGQVTLHMEWSPAMFTPGDVILCRNSKPLIHVFYSCLKHKLPAKILGSDIGRGLIAILKSKVPDGSKAEIEQAINKWMLYEYKKASDLDLHGRAQNVVDQAEVLQTILASSTTSRPKAEMIRTIQSIFTDDGAPILLSTIHKAKGLEWDRVFFLDSHLIPSKWAQSETELQQEANLKYVAITRAKHSLDFIESDNMEMIEVGNYNA